VKILQVVDFFKPFWSSGGITPVAYHVARGLALKGHDVTVYSNGDGRDASVKVRKNRPTAVDGMTVYYFRNLCPPLARRNIYTTYMVPFVSRRELRRFDVVHIHTYRSTMAVPAWHFAMKYRVPYVLQPHGTVETYFDKGTLKKAFDALWGRSMLKHAARLVAVTPAEAGQFERLGLGRDRVEIIPNGIDAAEFAALPPRGRFRAKQGFRDDERVVLYLGRIHSIKGLDLLVRAFASLGPDPGPVRLVLAGPDDGYLPALKKEIRDLKVEDRVTLAGALYGGDRLEAYVDADVCVLPSVYEVFGITLLEALMCGTPVVATDRCGVSPWLDNRGGYVVPFEAGALAGALRRMLADPDARRRFGEEGRRLVTEQFTWAGVVDRVEGLYREALAAK
jgi:glycosyltransferase involved in cell wall biosynthesis